MSANGNGDDSGSDQGGAGRREVAWRVFAGEYDDADFDYSESDEERAPNYVVTPTGARINRLFVVGVLTEVEQVSDDVLRGRVVDPTGAFVLYAGQYQPDEMAFLENANPPAFVAVTGKARTFQPDDSDRVFTSIRPESINEVDAETRDRWVVQTAEQTLSRVSTFADAIDSGERGDALRMALEANGVDAGLSSGIPLALDHYDTTKAYLAEVWDLAIDSARVVAGEISADDVGPLGLAPGEGGDEVAVSLDYSLTGESEAGETGDISELETESEESATETTETTPAEAERTKQVAEDTGTVSESTEDVSEETDDGLGDAPEPATEAESASEAAAEPATGTDTEPATETTTEQTTETTADAETDGEAVEPTESTDPGLGEAPTSTVEDGEAGDPAEAEAETAEVEDAADAAELQDEIGDDEPPTVETGAESSTDESFAPEDDGPDIGTAGAGDEMYEFDQEEREEVEQEYGLEFSSGSEVGEPGDADIDVPDPDEDAADESADETGTDELQETEPASGETPADEAEAETELETGDDADSGEADVPANLEETVMDTMRELNEGDGVGRETLLAAVVDDYDVTPADVDDALESALMSGRCYESGEDTLKPI